MPHPGKKIITMIAHTVIGTHYINCMHAMPESVSHQLTETREMHFMSCGWRYCICEEGNARHYGR